MAQSSREIDFDPSTYVGLSFPLRADDNNDFALTKNSLEQANHNLKCLLLTNLGERVALPEFGSGLLALCFEPDDGSLDEKIRTEVNRAVSLWLSYINIKNVSTFTDGVNRNLIVVKVQYSTILNPETLQEITVDASRPGSSATGGY